MQATLAGAFSPASIEIVDQSARHAGHAGARAEGETHYAVLLVSDAFQGQSRIDRHRRVQEALAPEFERGLHALTLTLRTVEEQATVDATRR